MTALPARVVAYSWLVVLAACSSPVTSAVAGDADGLLSAVDVPDALADTPPDAAADILPDGATDGIAADATTDADQAAAGIPLDELPDAVAILWCKENLASGKDFYPLKTCLFDYENYESKPLRDRIALVKLGRLSYDGVAAADCLAGHDGKNGLVIALSIGAWLTPRPSLPAAPAACLKVFVGTQSPGSACDDDAECATGRCWGCPTGVCMAGVALGEACGRAAPCATGMCFLGICQADVALAVGATCVDIADAAGLTPSNDIWFGQSHCQNPLVCKNKGNGVGQCVVGLPVGATCSDTPCQSGSSCNKGHCGNNPPQAEACAAQVCKAEETCSQATLQCASLAVVGENCANGEPCAQAKCDVNSKKCVVDNPCGPACQPSLCDKVKGCQVDQLGDACVGSCVNDGYFPTALACVKGVCRRKDNPACTFPPAAP